MSSIYGIWYRHGRPVNREEADGMEEAFGWWGPDESDRIVEGSLLIGQATLRNTPESKHERYPLRRGPYILAADARIDNREELARVLDLPDRPMEEIGDGEFILSAYEKWGEECADRLLGDFAFVIWDGKKRQLFCARDFIGVRPLYYYLDDERFLFGSDLEALIRSGNITPTVRTASVADYIANRVLTDREHTFFNEFNKLEGGCTLTVSVSKKSIQRYWNPELLPTQRKELRTIEEWRKTIRTLLEDAVRVRLRTDAPVAAHLSGGLDSTPVAVLTSRELRRHGALSLPVYSWQPQPGPTDNLHHFEWSYALETARREEMELHFSTLTVERILRGMQEYNPLYDRGSGLWNELEIRENLQDRGVRTMVSGWGGDEFVTHHGYPFYTQMLLAGRWINFILRLRERKRKFGMDTRAILKFLYRNVFIPMLPENWYCRMPRIRCSSPDFDCFPEKIAEELRRAYRNKTHIFSRYTSATMRTELLRAWKNGHLQHRLLHWSQEAMGSRLYYVYPLLDRRLVELSFAYPAHFLIRNGYDRYLYRLAIADTVPERLLWGIHKSEPRRWSSIQELMKISAESFERTQNSTDIDWSTCLKERGGKVDKRFYLYYLLLHLERESSTGIRS